MTGASGGDVWVVSATDTIFHAKGYLGGKVEWLRAPSPLEEFSIVPIHSAWTGPAGELRLGARTYNLFDEEGNFGPGNQFERVTADGGGIGWRGSSGTATIHAIWGATSDDVWIAGDNSETASWQLGLTMHGTRKAGSEGPLAWVEVDSQASVVLASIWGSSTADVWCVGDKGTIRHHSAGALRWDIVTSPTKNALHAIWGSAGNDVWAVGDDGTILHWDGVTWTPSVAAFPVGRRRPDLYGVWGSSADDVWIVGDGIALHHTGGGP